MTAVLLALLTAVVWGFANYLGPLLSRTRPLGAVLVAGQVVGVVGAVALFAVTGNGAPGARAAAFGVASGLFNGLALLTFILWAWLGPEPRFAYAIVNAVAVLIADRPHHRTFDARDREIHRVIAGPFHARKACRSPARRRRRRESR